VVICLEQGANDLCVVWLMPLPPPSSLASLKSGMVLPSGVGLHTPASQQITSMNE